MLGEPNLRNEFPAVLFKPIEDWLAEIRLPTLALGKRTYSPGWRR